MHIEWPLPNPHIDDEIAALQIQFDKWGVQHFTAREVCKLNAIQKGEPTHACPPPELWPNMRLTVWAADAIRKAWGAPVNVISGYRPPAYNARDPKKAKASLHMQFGALDLTPAKGFATAAEYDRWYDTCETAVTSVAKAATPVACTGVGRYPGRFVHIDVGLRTSRTRWEG
jgi:uncharacterized protein YcbK (DUF882 family)